MSLLGSLATIVVGAGLPAYLSVSSYDTMRQKWMAIAETEGKDEGSAKVNALLSSLGVLGISIIAVSLVLPVIEAKVN